MGSIVFDEEQLPKPWMAQEDDLIGGWCITLAEDSRTPAEGAPTIATFCSGHWALHLVKLHNDWLLSIKTVEV